MFWSKQTSAFEGTVFTHSDVRPGMVVKAKIAIIDSFGAIVQFASGVKALCPLRHMSEFEIVKPRKKFQVGAELVFRVLGIKSKRITVTHKKTLINYQQSEGSCKLPNPFFKGLGQICHVGRWLVKLTVLQSET